MKIHILYNFQKGPWGGGNQFLKALKKEFDSQDVYEEDLEKGEVILFNSHHNLEYSFKIKQKYPNKMIIYRLDGPISIVRGRDEAIDKILALFNNLFVDGIIFQSNWCREQNKKYFNISSQYETVIHNAPDNEIFNKIGKAKFDPSGRIKLITTSWSPNWRKGFEIYKFLDQNLDFSRYEMTFVGNSPIDFTNIKWVKSISSEKLADVLKQYDIYITASQNDPCSNSLIEALSCGLPAVALDDGGHLELVQKGGELFSGKEDVIEKIERVAQHYYYYQSKIPEFSVKKVGQEYYEFAERIYEDVQSDRYKPKKIGFFTRINSYRMRLMIWRWKGVSKLRLNRLDSMKEKKW